MLAGTLVVTVGGEEHTVYAGQTIDLIADRTHTYENPTDVPARFMMLVTMPPREHDRRLIRQRP